MKKPVAWKLWFLALFLFSASLLAAGCGSGTTPAEQQNETDHDTAKEEPTPAQEPADGQAPVQNQEPTSPQEPANSADSDTPVEHPAKRPETAEIPVTVEGMKETVTGTLTRSEELEYSFYLLPMFEWTAEEPGKDLIYFKNDDRFNVRIEIVEPEADLNMIRKSAEQELSSIGKIQELNGAVISEVFTKQAAVSQYASSEEVRKIIVVTDIDGTVFRFTMTLPHTEAVEGVEPRFWAMLETLQPERPKNFIQHKKQDP